jgi:hypothetical protein
MALTNCCFLVHYLHRKLRTNNSPAQAGSFIFRHIRNSSIFSRVHTLGFGLFRKSLIQIDLRTLWKTTGGYSLLSCFGTVRKPATLP